ncbi:MAG TPA: hypothetical protein VGG28_25530 [Kofleriaceae bacterium]|jgi:hypothetical protein
MHLPRYFGIVDLGIVAFVVIALVLPPREMFASEAIKGDDAKQFAVALAEARTIVHPEDGRVAEDFARALGGVNQKDWAIDAAVAASERSKGSPTRWHALIAASVAYVDRLDVVPGLDFANRALTACASAATSCPTWEQIRMELYQQSLDAGVKSGINPHKDPSGFRKASETNMREIHLGGSRESERGSAAPAGSNGATGVGSASAP